jgi:hypothetical protein
VKRQPLFVVVLLLAIATALPLAAGQLGGPGSSPVPTGTAVGQSPGPGTSPTAATPGPIPTPVPTPTPAPDVEVAIVPVTHFRSLHVATDRAEVASVLAGGSTRYEALELVESEADEILAALSLARPTEPGRLILSPDVATLSANLAETRTRLALVRADDVWPGIRALSWEGQALFGNEREQTLADWPLVARFEAGTPGAREPVYDPGAAWTLVAGGDILLDRGVAKAVKVDGKGIDFPFDGGTAEITGRTCCSQFGWEVPQMRRTGDAGAMRRHLQGADIAIANFENPAPNNFKWHTSGTTFSADPALIEGLVNAGIDWVSLANNHIRDFGANGILQTIENLDRHGLRHGGAGRNLAEARKPSYFDVGDTKVAILAYDMIARSYGATEDRVGSAQLTLEAATADIRTARAAGADIVVVYPHWGVEYQAKPTGSQQRLAHGIIDAGADMIIGNHAHWAAAMEIYNGKPIWYALGNFVFDQVWSEKTMQGFTLELTFHDAELVQAWLRPHIILDRAQPNFMEPTADGRIVLNQVFEASKGLLPW